MADEVRREWFDKDYYAVLGVPKNASAAEVKKAYRKLAQQHHPDTKQGDPDAETRFKEISAAYDVLGDAEKRKAYDQVRDMSASGFGPGFGAVRCGRAVPAGAGGPGGVRYEQVNVDDIGDLFGGLFGGAARRGGRRPAAQRGADLETTVTLSFEDAIDGDDGTDQDRRTGCVLALPRIGRGARHAAGHLPPVRRAAARSRRTRGSSRCRGRAPRCGGAGRIVESPCTKCRGTGAERRTRTLKVKIPAGVRNGARIRLAGKGEPGPAGGRPGDLFVKVAVEPHPVFGRRGDDLTLDLPISYPEATLGANVEVPTLNGPVTLKVPAGTPSGKTFRVKGRGAPKRGGHGDLLAKVQVDVPEKVSREEKELLRQLREASKESPRKRLGVR